MLDIAEPSAPRPVGHCRWGGGATHTCLPLRGRDLLVVTDEQQHDGPGAPERRIHLLDIADPGRPGTASRCPSRRARG